MDNPNKYYTKGVNKPKRMNTVHVKPNQIGRTKPVAGTSKKKLRKSETMNNSSN